MKRTLKFFSFLPLLLTQPKYIDIVEPTLPSITINLDNFFDYFKFKFDYSKSDVYVYLSIILNPDKIITPKHDFTATLSFSFFDNSDSDYNNIIKLSFSSDSLHNSNEWRIFISNFFKPFSLSFDPFVIYI